MRYLVNTNSKKKIYEKIIKETFPHIQYADFETFIRKNKVGIVVFDREEFQKKIENIKSLSEKENLNFVIIVESDSEISTYGLPDVFVVPEFDESVMEKVKPRILDKMEKLTREKIKNIQRDELEEYESLGVGILIIDDEEKIVYANNLLLRFLKNKYSLEKILNQNVREFMREIAPDFEIEKLFTGTLSTWRVKIILPDGTVEPKSISITPRVRTDNKTDGYILRFYEPLANEGERLLREIQSLVEEIQNIGFEIEDKFFIAIPRILKKFAEVLRLRSLLFIPFYIARIWEFENEAPFILVYKTVKDKYTGRFIYGFKANEEDKERCVNNYKLENFLRLYRKFDDIEEIQNVAGLKEFIKGHGDEIYGLLCLDRPELFDNREKYLVKLFVQSLRELIDYSAYSPERRLVNLIEKLAQSHGNSGVIVVEKDGSVIFVNKRFGEIFHISLDSIYESSIEALPGLRDNPRVLESVIQVITNDTPVRIEKWIKFPAGEEKYLVVSGIPAGEINIPGYIWIFEDRTSEKLEELKEFFFRRILEANSNIVRAIRTKWSGFSKDSTSEFYECVLKVLVRYLSKISDGVVATLIDPESDNVFCQVSQNLPRILTESELIRFVDDMNKFSSQLEGLKKRIVISNLKKFLGDSSLKSKFEWAIRIPINLETEMKSDIGTLILLSKPKGEFYRFVQAIYRSGDYTLNRNDENVFLQIAHTIAYHVDVFRKNIVLAENRKLLEEFYKHSNDLIIIADEEGKINLSNDTARSLLGKKNLEGSDLFSILQDAGVDKRNIDRLFDLSEEEEEKAVVNLRTDGKERWLKLMVKRIEIGDIQEFIIVGHDVSDFYKSQLSRNRAIIGLIAMLLNILADKSAIVARHSINVALIVKEILKVIKRGNSFNGKFTTNADRFCLITGAVLHDIGKINMASSYLIKPPERLREDSLIKKYYEEHPIIGSELLSNLGLPCDDKIPRWVMEHHEYMDGSGFPRKLMGDQISLGGRIIGIADKIENEIIRKPQRGVVRDLGILINEMKVSEKYDANVLKIVEKVYQEKGGEFLLLLNSTDKYEKREADMREAVEELLGPLLGEE